jgi:hypothetical protein
MKRYTLLLTLYLAVSSISLTLAQGVGIGEWQDHLPYNNCIAVADAGDELFCATPYSLFAVKKADNSTQRINKITGLSDAGISAIGYNDEFKTLLIAYTNTNLDLIKEGKIINISDIKRKSILGNKTINRIMFIGKYAYLSCGFGIVVLDVEKEEIFDTYYIGPEGSRVNVLDLTFNPVDNQFYAATETGIFRASADANLAYYISWEKDNGLPAPNGKYNLITAFGGKVYANSTKKTEPTYDRDTTFVYENGTWEYFDPTNHTNRSCMRVSQGKLIICGYLYVDALDEQGDRIFRIYDYNPGTVRPNDAQMDASGNVWIADINEGLVKNYNLYSFDKILLDGPASPSVYAMDVQGTDLWVAPGGRNSAFGNEFQRGAFYYFSDSKWRSYNYLNTPFLDTIRDLLAVAVDPRNHKHAFLGTWGNGLFEYLNGELVKFYTPENSSLQNSVIQAGWMGISGLCYDIDNNLWVANSSAPNILSVLKSNNTWKSFNLGASGVSANGVDVGSLAIDKGGQKWMLQRDHTMLVFNDNNTLDNVSDDKVKRLTQSSGNGGLIGNYIQCMAVDQDGAMWIGSDQGVAVFYNPENVFTTVDFDCQKILVKQGENYQYLLESESVTALAVNGDNQKWFGTDRAGVFLMSADGQEQIYHFTEENSPLLSNAITSIALNNSGDVFFGTSKGIISFKDKVIPSVPNNDSAYVYPNPVRADYTGPIAITNLVKDTDIKITDMSGTLIFKTKATGGQAVWNGQNFDGRRANSGVYLVFISNEDGSETLVTKILLFNR